MESELLSVVPCVEIYVGPWYYESSIDLLRFFNLKTVSRRCLCVSMQSRRRSQIFQFHLLHGYLLLMMHLMDNIEDLKKVASLSRNAKSWSVSRGEQVTYLHQTLISISNILDHEGDKLDRLRCMLKEKSNDESLCSESLQSGFPSSILQLYTRRLALQANAALGFRPVSLQSSPTGRDNSHQTDDDSTSLILLKIVSSLDHLCHNEWKHLFECRENPEAKPGTESDPFSKDCSFVDEQHHQLLMKQLDAVQERCKKLVEEEKRALAAVKASYLSRKDIVRQAGNEDKDGGLSFEECTWRIAERLAGYEDCLHRLLDDLWDWKDEHGIKILEDNQQILIDARWVKKLLALGLKFKQCQTGRTATKDEIERHKRVLKLSSDCFADLPLPLQNTVFQWLWDQPDGPNLFKNSAVINVEQELTHTFNRLVTGSTDTQLTERARDICSIALHCPSSTLQKAILEAVGNTDAGKLICKVLQCIPFLLQLQVDGTTCFLTELSRYVRTLGVRELSSTEEVNLFKFADAIMKSYRLPTHPGSIITCPPLVCPLHLADSCIWPFLGPTSKDHTNRPDPRPPSHLSSGSLLQAISVPRHTTLKLLDLVLRNSLSSTNEQEQGVLDISVCFSTVLSLCQLLQDCIFPADGDAGYNFLIKEMNFDLLKRMSSYVKEVHTDALSACSEWLLKETSDLDWTVRLTLHALFSDRLPSCEKEVSSCIEEITGSIQLSQPITESVPLYVAWSSSLMAFFQGARISSQLSKQFVKSLSGTSLSMTSPSRVDFYRAVCLALAQVLPHSASPEWLTTLKTLDLLRVEGLLHVTYTTHFMTSLPACDITICQRPLQLSQIFTTVIQLLSEAAFSDWLKDDQWQHITKSYTQVMKKILSDATENISSSPSSSAQASQVFLIGQLFCQSCEVSRCVSESSTEQLFVWCLELVMRVEELLSCCGDDVVASGVICDVAYHEMKTLSRAIEWLPSSGQRTTLQQKLSTLSSRY